MPRMKAVLTGTFSIAQEAHSNYFIPESRKIAKSSTYKGLEIDFNKPQVPFLPHYLNGNEIKLQS